MENPPSIEVRSQEGKAARLIRHVAEETEADLLVLGTRGQGRIARFFLGSTAHAFAENPPCDVLFLTPKAAAI
jgi:nucleotide-binding universal stress UspA family protein